MIKILVAGAGGTPSINFIRSIKKYSEKIRVIGTEANKYYLFRSEADKNYLIPRVSEKKYLNSLNHIINKERIQFMHIQNDEELKFVSENREKIKTDLFLPSKKTIRICQDKYLSYQAWKKANIKVAETKMINSVKDLSSAFKSFNGKIWIRSIKGAAGKWSMPVEDIEIAKSWINIHKGWGKFIASELLKENSITWMSIWYNGELIIAQSRKRLYWELSRLTLSGVTGITGAACTVSDPVVDDIAQRAIKAIDDKPHGLYGVDMTYDSLDRPNPTEINIGRFFTTIDFFTKAGLNMPMIYINSFFKKPRPKFEKKINPLKPGLLWIRGMDIKPKLITLEKLENLKNS